MFLLGVAFSIANTHLQITYYLLLLCFFVYLGYLFNKLKEKAYKELGTVTAIMAGCVILAVLPNAQNMYAQWDLGQNSIRGATELTTTTLRARRSLPAWTRIMRSLGAMEKGVVDLVGSECLWWKFGWNARPGF